MHIGLSIEVYLCSKLARYPPPFPIEKNAAWLEFRATRAFATQVSCTLLANPEVFPFPRYEGCLQWPFLWLTYAPVGPFDASPLWQHKTEHLATSECATYSPSRRLCFIICCQSAICFSSSCFGFGGRNVGLVLLLTFSKALGPLER